MRYALVILISSLTSFFITTISLNKQPVSPLADNVIPSATPLVLGDSQTKPSGSDNLIADYIGSPLPFPTSSVPISSPVVTIIQIPTPVPTLKPTPTLTLVTPIPTVPPTPLPIASPTLQPTASPTSSIKPASASDMDTWFNEFAASQSVNVQLLRKIAVCESGYNQFAKNGIYGGLYQFSASSWSSTRAAMNADINPDLRFDAREAIRTAAFKIATSGTSIWPNCSK